MVGSGGAVAGQLGSDVAQRMNWSRSSTAVPESPLLRATARHSTRTWVVPVGKVQIDVSSRVNTSRCSPMVEDPPPHSRRRPFAL